MKMNLKRSFLLRLAILASLFLTILSSCKKEKTICDTNTICYTVGPDDLYLKLKISPQSYPVEISVYKGTYDKGTKIDHFFTNSDVETYLLPINETYTATAKYVVKGDTIMAIDSGKMSDGSYTNCENSCYDWDEALALDIRLND